MQSSSPRPSRSRLASAAQVIVVTSVMFTFISYWRTAAVVLCDLASTAYYIGGIVEASVGPAAPWFILAVMLFSYIVRSVYIESCSLFVRGGVYRIVREALGGFAARIAVSALMFDYILTGPISSVSAGQYIMGWVLDLVHRMVPALVISGVSEDSIKSGGAVIIACVVTLYFWRQNLRGIHESSDKAVKIMIATTVMAAVIGIWCVVTLVFDHDRPKNPVPLTPDFAEQSAPAFDSRTNEPVLDPETGEQKTELVKKNELGYLKDRDAGREIVELDKPGGQSWWSVIGAVGILIAFSHSILAMSGEETLAQVYREVESPKLPNFKKAAFIVFIYSLVFTAGISFLAVILIPHGERIGKYSDNLIGGLAMNVMGPVWAQLALQGFVVVVGFLILSGAVNTAIIGSNGVLNRVSEDGVLPTWFLKPHPRYGTTDRLLGLIVGLQLATILITQGDVRKLGEAYAFGVVWSFVFMTGAMLVLRFKRPGPREFKVPFNIRVGKIELPLGLGLVFVVLVLAAFANLLTKEVATKWGLGFTASFLAIFTVTEFLHHRALRGRKQEHLDHFNRQTAGEVTPETLHIDKPFRKLVAIRSPQNLFMLEKALSETDPATTAVVVMTAKLEPVGEPLDRPADMDSYDQQLMTAVVERAEKAGKQVTPLIVPTNNPLYAVIRTAKDIQAQELIVGLSNKHTADEQLDQIAFYWFNVQQGQPVPLTVRVLSRDRDVHLDLHGGNRVPKISERQARSVAELRAAGVGVNRVLALHDGTAASSDLLQNVMTMLDPQVTLDLLSIPAEGGAEADGQATLQQEQDRAKQLGREMDVHHVEGDLGPAIVKLARQEQYDLIILALPPERHEAQCAWSPWTEHVLSYAHCMVFLAAQPAVPQHVEE